VETDGTGGPGDLREGSGRRSRLLSATVFMPRRRAAIIVLALGSSAFAVVLGARLLTDFWWFAAVGHTEVFWRMLELRAGLLAGAGGAASVYLLATLWTAMRRVPVKVSAPAPLLAGSATCIAVAARSGSGRCANGRR
jgi:Uncharacterised protein family (UPF0182)